MVVIVAMDDYGHFCLSPISERNRTIHEVLTKIHDGSYFDDINNDRPEEGLYSMNDDEWLAYLQEFVQRGTCEMLSTDL